MQRYVTLLLNPANFILKGGAISDDSGNKGAETGGSGSKL